MFVRIGFVLRTLENFDSITDAYSKKLCRNYQYAQGRSFFLKVSFIKNPFTFVTLTFVLTIFILAYIMRIFELPYDKLTEGKTLMSTNTDFSN